MPSRTRLIHFFGVVSLAMSALGCGGPLEVELCVPWQAGETSVLELSQRGERLGTITLSVEGNGDWLLGSRTEIEGYLEETTVRVDRSSLLPRTTIFSLDRTDARVTYEAHYEDQRVRIHAERPDGPQDVEVRLPEPPYYENEQFLMLLRTLPLTDTWKGRFNVIVTRTASKAEISVEVTKRETVSTPAGDFEAWRLDLKGTGQAGWVEVAPPHRLVKYVNTNAETVSLLSEYTP